MTEPNDDMLRDWLLGKLASTDAEPLEQRLIADEDFSMRLRAVENDLLDDFARGQLAGEERVRAAAYFAATPEDRVRLRIARALASVRAAPGVPATAHSAARVQPRRSRRHVIFGVIASAAALALLVVGVNRQPPIDSGALPTITLTANQQRGATDASVGVPRSASGVRLQVEVDPPDASARYAVEIDAGDRKVFSARNLAARTAGPYTFVEVVLAPKVLAAGAYRVRVLTETGDRPAAVWSFHTHDE